MVNEVRSDRALSLELACRRRALRTLSLPCSIWNWFKLMWKIRCKTNSTHRSTTIVAAATASQYESGPLSMFCLRRLSFWQEIIFAFGDNKVLLALLTLTPKLCMLRVHASAMSIFSAKFEYTFFFIGTLEQGMRITKRVMVVFCSDSGFQEQAQREMGWREKQLHSVIRSIDFFSSV